MHRPRSDVEARSRVLAFTAVAVAVAIATIVLGSVSGHPSGDPAAATASSTRTHADVHLAWLARPQVGDRLIPLGAGTKRAGLLGLFVIGGAGGHAASAAARRRGVRSPAVRTTVQRVPQRRRGPPALA